MKKRGALSLALLGGFAALLLLETLARDSRPRALPATLPEAGVRCAADAESAADRAHDCTQIADAEIERYPFAPSEGMRALRSLAEASDCYALARRARQRLELEARSRRLRARLERDLRDHLLRYQRARAAERRTLALANLDFALALFANEHGSALSALNTARCELEAASALGVAR